jgi:UTP--glucose-1-phosphate uridylyltransferase
MIKKAVIPAAGYGTRFLPATKSVPKELFPIVDTPTLQLIVEELIESGITEILIIVSHYKNAILDHFDRNVELETILKEKNRKEELEILDRVSNLANIHFIRQKEQLGLGHAILHAKTFVGNEPFAVLLGDDLFKGNPPAIKELVNVYEKVKSSVVGTMLVKPEETRKYGICDTEKVISPGLYKLKGVIEKPEPKKAPSLSAISGRYILTPKIFELLETQEKGHGGEIQLTDAILKLMKTESVYAYDIKAKRYDIGSKLGFLEAQIDYALDSPLKEDVLKLLKEKAK